MEFPTIDQLAKDVAEKALDEITYEGKTIREWVEIIVKQQPCEDCISREEAKNLFLDGTEGYDCRGFTRMEIGEMLDELPSVTLQQQSVTDFVEKCKECGKILNDKLQTSWISVSERLPEDYSCCLCTIRNHYTYDNRIEVYNHVVVYNSDDNN